MRLTSDGKPVRSCVAVLVVAAGLTLPRFGYSAAAAPAPVEGADLLRLVKTLYGESRKAIRTVEYDYRFELNGVIRRARYARDGERVYSAGVWESEGGFSLPRETTWDGQRVHDRWNPGEMNRSRDKGRFNATTPLPENYALLYGEDALGFQPKQTHKYRFVRGRNVDDKEHGPCVELEFAAEFAEGSLLTRHARRYAYAPIHWRLVYKSGPGGAGGPGEDELTEARYAKFESDGNEVYYPTSLALTFSGEGPNGSKYVSRNHFQIDEATLKVNQPIPHARFVLEAWPNENVRDWEKETTARAKEPGWSPVEKVDFPWSDFVAMADRNRKRRESTGAGGVAARNGEPLPMAAPRRPWAEAGGAWLALTGLAVVAGGGYVVYRRRHPRQPQPLGRAA